MNEQELLKLRCNLCGKEPGIAFDLCSPHEGPIDRVFIICPACRKRAVGDNHLIHVEKTLRK